MVEKKSVTASVQVYTVKGTVAWDF
jgi:hypothetical protein